MYNVFSLSLFFLKVFFFALRCEHNPTGFMFHVTLTYTTQSIKTKVLYLFALKSINNYNEKYHALTVLEKQELFVLMLSHTTFSVCLIIPEKFQR